MIRKFMKFIAISVVLLSAAGLGLLYMSDNQLLSVQSGSMKPHINKGDVVVVTDASNADLAVGDIITFTSHSEEITVTHRIVKLPDASNDFRFITKGDANGRADSPLDGSQIVGRVDKHIPYLGYGLDFAKTPLGLLTIIYVPALLIVIDEIRRLSAHYKKVQVWRHQSYKSARKPANKRALGAMLGSGSLLLSLATALPVYAVMTSHASLTGNTISTVDDPNDCDNTEDVDINIDGGSGGSTTIDIDVDTDQDASSGDATNSGNTNGGDATSGDATNCNSTDIDIVIIN